MNRVFFKSSNSYYQTQIGASTENDYNLWTPILTNSTHDYYNYISSNIS